MVYFNSDTGRQAGKKGGPATTDKMTPEQRKARSRKGGLATADIDGHLQTIGAKGGQSTKLLHGADHYRRIGKMGANARIYGTKHYQQVGSLGGKATKEKHPDHYRQMAETRWQQHHLAAAAEVQ